MKYIGFFIIIPLLFWSCSRGNEKLFSIRPGHEIGIDFQNKLTESDTFNSQTFDYIYNGSGVGVGDFNNDGLEDVFFGGNQVSSQLYLNEGKLKFKNISAQAGINTSRWITGVSIVDINQDGLLDIYLSVGGKAPDEKRRDLLYINSGVNDGIPHFIEAAKSYGLDDDSYSTMAVFLDYDKDGDLDMYLVNNWLEKFNRNNLHQKRISGEAKSTDRLFRNNGNNTFTNVSREAGILIEGYGLGAVVCDLNDDSWPDVYVTNDFLTNDLIWINQKDGTFKNRAGDYLKHQSHNAMGIDIADFNNDGLPDIAVVDMLPPDNKRQKLMLSGQNFDYFERSIAMGYQPQYVRNTLQLNRGQDTTGKPMFSEISFMAGVAKTDWSWAPLFADFDNDGLKDLFIGNGYRKDVTNLDFIFFSMNNNPTITRDSARAKKYYKKLKELPEVKISNFVFRNDGDLRFEDKTSDWGLSFPDYSNGAAYADFDLDGDLDLITNNLDQEAVLFENQLNLRTGRPHFIDLKCRESGSFNQKIAVYANGLAQFQELTPYRGFQSSVSTNVHFGLGNAAHVDSVIVTWPNQFVARYKNLSADKTFPFSIHDAALPQSTTRPTPATIFKREMLNGYVHRETSPTDFKITRTLLHEITRYGPCVTTADINADGLDDFFIGSEKGYAGKLFTQQKDGSFEWREFTTDKDREDGGALFFDADNDGDADIYIASSCSTSAEDAKAHRLFLNDGKGNFLESPKIPKIFSSASCVEAADYDGDGDLDLFVGGRIKSKSYPLPSRSYVLRNDGGNFKDVTNELNPQLLTPGLVSAVLWADYNNDKRPDLIICGEWMPIRVFRNDKSVFTEVTDALGLGQSNGWWNCLKAGDFNSDGFIDIVAGNTGKNSFFQPTLNEPVQIIAKDFDKNGSIDPIVTYYNTFEQGNFIIHNRLVLLDQVPMFKKRFKTFTRYGMTPSKDALSTEEMKNTVIMNAYTLSSSLFINRAGQRMEIKELPMIAQLSTVNDIVVEDVNNDHLVDLILIGNDYAQEPTFGRYDASIGTILLNQKELNWREMKPSESNFIVDTDAKYIRKLHTAGADKYMIVSNESPIYFFQRRKK